ncbi:hypothetical protein FGG78_16130 [Thioclava sp. BHET1]|nr:hypothetical protein FGG78_16130 [Thioclava sp. BHET1]
MSRILPVLALSLMSHPLIASAQEGVGLPSLPPPPGLEEAVLLPGWQRKDGTRMAGLQFKLEPGWKTYWRIPGDSGIPPRISFTGSQNVASLSLHWPAPEIFTAAGARTVGYHDALLLPVEITPVDPSMPVMLRAQADIGICDHICVPVSLQLETTLTAPGPTSPDPQITQALEKVPRIASVQAACVTEPVADGTRLTARLTLPQPIGPEATLFELAKTPTWVSEPIHRREGTTLIASAEFVPPEAAPFAIEAEDVRITVLSELGALEIRGCHSISGASN